MSMMLCSLCEGLVDTDGDPDSLYAITDQPLDCVCKGCRDRHDIATDFDEAPL